MVHPAVILVEHDAGARESLAKMLRVEGIRVETHMTARESLESYDAKKRGCMVLDFHLPDMDAFDLHRELVDKGCQLPFIVLTANGKICDATEAMRRGAEDVLGKPPDREVFLGRVRQAIAKDTKRHGEQAAEKRIQSRLNSLTPREREVLDLVMAGKLSKQIAKQLGISMKTVETHRSNITRKMNVGSFIELVHVVASHLPPHFMAR